VIVDDNGCGQGPLAGAPGIITVKSISRYHFPLARR
jgi:hypothetical protein